MRIKQQIPKPKKPRPIVIIGAGGIVRDAHLPAYKLANYSVLGVFDVDVSKANSLVNDFAQVGQAYETLDKLIIDAQAQNAIYDLAVPANHISAILRQIPDNSGVLIQKPMGNNLEECEEILKICRTKNLKSAVNFQLRYAPYCIAARDMISQGLLGEVFDIELKVCVHTPWHLWDFLKGLPRVEILYHSIHYLDVIRSFLGNPNQIMASTIPHPNTPDLSQTRSTMILHYSKFLQARILTNHGHVYGHDKQESYLKIEGTKGAIKIRIGLSLNYPKGLPPLFEYCLLNEGKATAWKELPLVGGWFPHAFIGSMAVLQNHMNDSSIPLNNSTEDAYNTMKLVEAAYISNNIGGVSL